MATCSSCGAKILWMTDQTGVKIPLDPTRVRMYVRADKKGPDRFLTLDGQPYLAHISHYKTCPNASLHSMRSTQHREQR